MKIEFDVTASDYRAFNEQFLKRSKTHRRSLLINSLFCAAAMLILPAGVVAAQEKPFEGFPVWMAPLLLGPIVVVPLYLLLVKWRVRRALQSMIDQGEASGALGPRTLSLESSGIHGSSSSGEGRINWSAVTAIESTGGRIFVFLNNASGLVIPRNAFRDESHCQAFLAELEQRAGVSGE